MTLQRLVRFSANSNNSSKQQLSPVKGLVPPPFAPETRAATELCECMCTCACGRCVWCDDASLVSFVVRLLSVEYFPRNHPHRKCKILPPPAPTTLSTQNHSSSSPSASATSASHRRQSSSVISKSHGKRRVEIEGRNEQPRETRNGGGFQ